MSSPFKILRSCSVRGGVVRVDGAAVFAAAPADDFAAFSAAAFRALGVDYPKFYRMDNLSKLGFLAGEYLLAGQPGGGGERTGIVLGNASSSLDTDLRYAAQRRRGVASPALFVYTLPNIVVGELCIRHGIRGENLLLVSERYDPVAQVACVGELLARQRLSQCLGGWLDLLGEQYEAFFYLAGPGAAALPDYTAATVARLYAAGSGA